MGTRTIFCSVCEKSIACKAFSGHLRSISHKNNTAIHLNPNIEQINSAFRKRIISYRVKCDRNGDSNSACITSSVNFLTALAPHLHQLLDTALTNHVNIKVNFELFTKFILPKDDTIEIKSFATENMILHQSYSFSELLQKLIEKLSEKIDQFQEKGSGWSCLDILYLEVNINSYSPLHASRYIKLPNKILFKRACVNIKNNDDYCFAWSVVAALYPAQKNSNRTSSYPHFSTLLNLQNMEFPVSLSDIRTFEKNNVNLSVNVYGLERNKIIGPLYKTLLRKKNHINLLLLQNNSHSHFCLIKDLPKLVRSQITKHHGKLYFCDSCLLFLKMENHVCGGVTTILPEEGSILQFKNYQRMQNLPFVIYADFETILSPQSEKQGNNTLNVQQHIPSAFAYYIVCNYDSSLNKLVSYRGHDCSEKFVKMLQRDVKKIHDLIKEKSSNPITMKFSDSDKLNFESAQYCYLCGAILLDDKVRDHCHFTGKYRGAAHNLCNLNFQVPKFVPVFFHNLSGYDCHLFIRELSSSPGMIKVIPKTKENYISFTKFIQLAKNDYVALRFVDSFKFLSASLEQLVKNLNTEHFTHLRQYFADEKQFELLCRKGVYPYDYMTSWSTYKETSLPSMESFYNKFTNESISKSDYDHAVKVWNYFKISNMGEYTDLYVKSDVLLLADIFENFRKTCMLNYNLDPAFYLTAPSLSFDAMLLSTKVKLELLTDLSMIRMIQKGIRGGICLCSLRYAKSNNKYQNDFISSQDSKFLVYIDCNNLYGFAMCSYLPLSDFCWLSNEEIMQINILNIPDDSEYGFILEVDLEYPEYLHDLHNDLPFCAERFSPPGSKCEKLIPNLYDKYFYVIHYIHLKTCIKNGLILKKVHRVIRFKQSPYLKSYIDLNTKLRQSAKSVFEQDFFKMLNNSLFGKTLEDTERRVDVKLVNLWNDRQNRTKKCYGASQLIARPNFHSATIFDENLAAIQLNREKVVLDKPIYIGFSVLELSKNHMYDFHYAIMKKHYNNKLSLCYTDTDSFLYSVQTKDFYEDLKNHFGEYFDTSNYPLNNNYDIKPSNKKVPGLFKDELSGNILLEFVGLRSKLYSFKTSAFETKKAKGIKKSVAKGLKFSDYTYVLNTGVKIRKHNLLFKCIKHEIFTQKQNKVALSRNDDKRFILKDNISTKSWGHYSITV